MELPLSHPTKAKGTIITDSKNPGKMTSESHIYGYVCAVTAHLTPLKSSGPKHSGDLYAFFFFSLSFWPVGEIVRLQM